MCVCVYGGLMGCGVVVVWWDVVVCVMLSADKRTLYFAVELQSSDALSWSCVEHHHQTCSKSNVLSLFQWKKLLLDLRSFSHQRLIVCSVLSIVFYLLSVLADHSSWNLLMMSCFASECGDDLCGFCQQEGAIVGHPLTPSTCGLKVLWEGDDDLTCAIAPLTFTCFWTVLFQCSVEIAGVWQLRHRWPSVLSSQRPVKSAHDKRSPMSSSGLLHK